MIEYQCEMVDPQGVQYEVRLLRDKRGMIVEQWRWFADIYSIDPMPTLAKGISVTVLNDGRSVEAFVHTVYPDNGARIVFEVDPPWQ